jgi:Flp pilus assembly protein TadB
MVRRAELASAIRESPVRLFPRRVNADFPVWFAYPMAAATLAMGVLDMATRHWWWFGALLVVAAAGWAWLIAAVHRSRTTQRHGRQLP